MAVVEIDLRASFRKKTSQQVYKKVAGNVVKRLTLEAQKEVKQTKFKKPTGLLLNSIGVDIKGLEGSVSSPQYAKYGRYPNDGTAPHTIQPKDKDALYWDGADHPVKSVHHPGIKAMHYVENAVEKLQKSGKVKQIVHQSLQEEGLL